MMSFEDLAREYEVELNETFMATNISTGKNYCLRFTINGLQMRDDGNWVITEGALSELLAKKLKIEARTFKPKLNDKFYFVISYLDRTGKLVFYTQQKLWQGTLEDYVKFRAGNCFKIIPSDKTIQTMFEASKDFYEKLV